MRQRVEGRTLGPQADRSAQAVGESKGHNMINRNTARAMRARNAAGKLVLVAGLAFALTACDENGKFSLKQPDNDQAMTADSNTKPSATRLVERDVEAPDAFQVTEAGLWDGRPSLGGVWVAHPDVDEPERVIIRNTANNKFVIGALFRRERENPGPRVQVSSDAAAALGMLAGQPAKLNVTALRREEIAEAPSEAPTVDAPPAPAEVTATKLDPVAGAAAAIAAAEAKPDTPAAKPAAVSPPKPQPKPAPKPRTSGLTKPWLQIGIFSVEANAKATADKMRKAGMVPTVHKQSSQGKTFWRVVVGPAGNKSERDALLKQIKAQGFGDAYAVTN